MKKLFLMAALLQLTVFAFSQNKQGNWLVGTSFGSSGFSFGDSKSGSPSSPNVSKSESHSFNIGVNPNVGYYVTDKTVIGVNFSTGYNTSKNDNSNNYNTNTSTSKSHYFYFGLGPFARLYLGDLNNKGMPYAQVSGGISFYPGYKGEYTPSTGSGYTYNYSNYHPWNAAFQLGYEHYLNTIIALYYYIAYTYNHYKYTTTYDYPSLPSDVSNYESHSSNVGFGVGLQIHLACDKKGKK